MQSCLFLYSLCANLLHSLIIRLIISSLSPYNLLLIFCCVLSIFTFILLALIALFCAAIRRDSFSFEGFSFRCYIQVFSCAISPVCFLKYPYICCFSYFCFLVFVVVLLVHMLSVLLLTTLISLSLLILM